MQAARADRGLDPADDGRGGLAAELLKQDRARQRIDRIEALAPTRIARNRAAFERVDFLHPRTELAVALAQVRVSRLCVVTANLARHAQRLRATMA